MFAVVIWVLVAVVLLLLLALAMPLRLEVRLSKEEAVRFNAALRPFGRFGPRIALSDRKKPPKIKARKARAKPALRSKWKLHPKRVFGAVVELVTNIIGCVRFDEATVDVRFGCGDPAETGEVYGQMTPLIYGTSGMPRVHVQVQPVFDQAMFRGSADLTMSLIPLQLLPPLARFGWAAFGPVR